MGLADSVKAEHTTPGLPCGVADARARLTPKERVVLDKLLKDPHTRHSELAFGLTKEAKRKVSADTVSRHRRERCCCYGTR